MRIPRGTNGASLDVAAACHYVRSLGQAQPQRRPFFARAGRVASGLGVGCPATRLRCVQVHRCMSNDNSSRGTGPRSQAHREYDAEESRFSMAFVTTNSMQQAERVSDALLNDRLVACVNIVPGITSKYIWEGKIQQDTEQLLLIKTRTELLDKVILTVKANHSYDVPEVISVPIQEGNPPYLKWLEESTRSDEPSQQ